MFIIASFNDNTRTVDKEGGLDLIASVISPLTLCRDARRGNRTEVTGGLFFYAIFAGTREPIRDDNPLLLLILVHCSFGVDDSEALKPESYSRLPSSIPSILYRDLRLLCECVSQFPDTLSARLTLCLP